MMHFEDLWTAAEQIATNNSSNESSSDIIDQLLMKINLYRLICQKSKPEDKKIRSRAFGEILYTLTTLSLKENINVFEALLSAINFRKN